MNIFVLSVLSHAFDRLLENRFQHESYEDVKENLWREDEIEDEVGNNIKRILCWLNEYPLKDGRI